MLQTKEQLFYDLVVTEQTRAAPKTDNANTSEDEFSQSSTATHPYFASRKMNQKLSRFRGFTHFFKKKAPSIENNQSLDKETGEDVTLMITEEEDHTYRDDAASPTRTIELQQKDICERLVPLGVRIVAAPEDAMLLIFSYLTVPELVHIIGVTCKYWRRIYSMQCLNDIYLLFFLGHNFIWEKYLLQKFGTLEPPKKSKKKKRKKATLPPPSLREQLNNSTKSALAMEIAASLALPPKYEANKEQKAIFTKNTYFNIYRFRIQRRKKRQFDRIEAIKMEQLRQRYETMLHKPQLLCESLYFSVYTPLFFLLSLISSVLFSLWMENILVAPGGNVYYTKWMPLFLVSPFLFLVVPFFFVAMIAAFVADWIKMLRYDIEFDSFSTLIYAGNIWIPICSYLVVLKLYVVPEHIQWRVIMSPLWVICVLYVVLTLILHKKVPNLRFDLDQRVMYILTTIANLIVTMVSGLVCAKLDGTLSADLTYSRFLFVPIWLFLIASCVAIPIGGYIFLYGAGWGPTMCMYTPLTTLFVFPFIPFAIMLSLKLDVLIDTSWVIVFAPLHFWLFTWFVMTLVFAIMYTCGICRKPSQ